MIFWNVLIGFNCRRVFGRVTKKPAFVRKAGFLMGERISTKFKRRHYLMNFAVKSNG